MHARPQLGGHGPVSLFLQPSMQTTYSIHATFHSLLPLLSILPLEDFHPLALVSQHQLCHCWTLVSHLNRRGYVVWSGLLEWRITWVGGMSMLRAPYIGLDPTPGFSRSCWGPGPPGPPGMPLEIPLGVFPCIPGGILLGTPPGTFPVGASANGEVSYFQAYCKLRVDNSQ